MLSEKNKELVVEAIQELVAAGGMFGGKSVRRKVVESGCCDLPCPWDIEFYGYMVELWMTRPELWLNLYEAIEVGGSVAIFIIRGSGSEAWEEITMRF